MTTRRLAAARRAVRQEAEAVALFPELARWRTPEERLADMDRRADAFAARLDAYQAAEERRAIERWNGLTYEQQGSVARGWASKWYPREIVYFLDAMWREMRPCDMKPGRVKGEAS